MFFHQDIDFDLTNLANILDIPGLRYVWFNLSGAMKPIPSICLSSFKMNKQNLALEIVFIISIIKIKNIKPDADWFGATVHFRFS